MNSKWTFAGYIKHGWQAGNVIAAQSAVPVKVAENRYLTVYALLDTRGHDIDQALLKDTFLYCKEVRVRYTLLQLLWDLELLDAISGGILY